MKRDLKTTIDSLNATHALIEQRIAAGYYSAESVAAYRAAKAAEEEARVTLMSTSEENQEGVVAALHGTRRGLNPYRDSSQRAAWFAGYDVQAEIDEGHQEAAQACRTEASHY